MAVKKKESSAPRRGLKARTRARGQRERAAAAGAGGKRARKANGKTHASAKTRAKANGHGGRAALPLLEGGRRQVPCLSCGLCCTYVALEIDEPDTAREAAEVLWYLYHQGVSIYVEDDDWLVQFETRCQHLGDDNRCGIYERRPDICRAYDEKNCEVNAAEVGDTFHTPRQFLDHLRATRPRMYKYLMRDYGPPEESLDGHPAGKRRLASFPARYARIRAQGSP